jgi:hypothetical protein
MSVDDPRDWEAIEDRREERRRSLGQRLPHCSVPGCRETDPLALTGIHPEILCYEHDAVRNGRDWLEDHHLAGRANDPATVRIPGNDHRAISERQNVTWRRETLRNPEGSPLIKAAAEIRGWLDILWLILERTVASVPTFLEALDAWLIEEIGPRWWDKFPESP